LLSGVQLALRIQHVDVDTHANLIARLVRIERGLRRHHRRLERLHLRQPGSHAQIGRTRVERRLTASVVEIGCGFFLQRCGFAFLRHDRAAGIQRD